MLPWKKAQAWQEEHSVHPFNEVVSWYLSNGLVYNTKDSFMLATEVYWDEETEQILPDREPNAWFVELAATSGRIKNVLHDLVRVAPHGHKFALWARRNEPRIRAFDWETVTRKAGIK